MAATPRKNRPPLTWIDPDVASFFARYTFPGCESVVSLVHHYDHPHPGVDTAFPTGHSCWQRGGACRWSRFRIARFDKLIRITLWLRREGPVREHLSTLRSWIGVARQAVQAGLKSAAKVLYSREGMSFTTDVLDSGLVSRVHIHTHQFELSLCCIQHRIKPPGPSVLVGLQFTEKITE